jgi:hypothetical protein
LDRVANEKTGRRVKIETITTESGGVAWHER